MHTVSLLWRAVKNKSLTDSSSDHSLEEDCEELNEKGIAKVKPEQV